MDIVDVPLLSWDDNLDHAMSQMRNFGRRAIVVYGPTRELRLLRNVDVLRAWRMKQHTLEQIPWGEYVDPLPDVNGNTFQEEMGASLAGSLSRFGVVEDIGFIGEVRPPMIRLLTQNETIAYVIKSTQKIWCCSNPSGRHSGILGPDDPCPQSCGTCGSTVRCS